MEIIAQLGIIFLLILLNSFFVASEYALVTVRKTRIEELVKNGQPDARRVLKAHERLDKYISATQLGITLAALALGWVGEPIAANLVEPLLYFLPSQIAFVTTHTVAITVAFLIITYLEIVLGELVPKTFALAKSEQTALWTIGPLHIFTQIFRPFIWFLNRSGNLILRLFFGVNASKMVEQVHSEDEIKMLVAQSMHVGAIEEDEAEMALNAFALGEKEVKEVMVPIENIIKFDSKATLKNVTDTIEQQRHSRYLVYQGSINKIIGFVHVKDIIVEILERDPSTKLRQLDIIRPLSYFPENKKIDFVFHLLRKRKQRMGIVENFKGKTVGVVYLEDIIENIVGKTEDEFDKTFK